MSFCVNATGQIVLNQSKPQRQITTIGAWTNAFLVFTAIYLRAHPNRTQELLKYGHIIRMASTRFQGWGWRTYDRHFRLRQKSHPHNSWAVIDGELWTLFVAVPAFNVVPQAQGGVNNSFRGSNQKGSTPKSTQGAQTGGAQHTTYRAPQKGKGRKFGKNFCYHFNNKGSCSRQDCKFNHTCSSCKQEGHGASTCPNK